MMPFIDWQVLNEFEDWKYYGYDPDYAPEPAIIAYAHEIIKQALLKAGDSK